MFPTPRLIILLDRLHHYTLSQPASSSIFHLSCISNKASLIYHLRHVYVAGIWVRPPYTQYFAVICNSQCCFHFFVVTHVYSEAVYTYKHCCIHIHSVAWGPSGVHHFPLSDRVSPVRLLQYPCHFVDAHAATNNGHDNDSNADSAQ